MLGPDGPKLTLYNKEVLNTYYSRIAREKSGAQFGNAEAATGVAGWPRYALAFDGDLIRPSEQFAQK
ncbi:Hypothetical predicted protein [Cloeon dipterum]|uniref:Uncharacterized protein n=1 Tax=Cloeon dipterum TaxID=197152 RepID=A0A8S1E3W7_9INSE|nr:Hypothetical predicted protein [Cloeon dipterum]